MSRPQTALTSKTAIGRWLDDPVGGPLIRELLGQGGFDERRLDPVRSLALQQLVDLSQGRLPQAVIDDLVIRANGGVVPAEEDSTGTWQERIVPSRFEGRTVIVTGAASGTAGRAHPASPAKEGASSP
jgi:hypothetical protein